MELMGPGVCRIYKKGQVSNEMRGITWAGGGSI